MSVLVDDLLNIISTYASWEFTFRLYTISEHLTKPLYDKNNITWRNKLAAEYANVLPDRGNLDWLTFYWKITLNHYGEQHLITSYNRELSLGSSTSTVNSYISSDVVSGYTVTYVHILRIAGIGTLILDKYSTAASSGELTELTPKLVNSTTFSARIKWIIPSENEFPTIITERGEPFEFNVLSHMTRSLSRYQYVRYQVNPPVHNAVNNQILGYRRDGTAVDLYAYFTSPPVTGTVSFDNNIVSGLAPGVILKRDRTIQYEHTNVDKPRHNQAGQYTYALANEMYAGRIQYVVRPKYQRFIIATIDNLTS